MSREKLDCKDKYPLLIFFEFCFTFFFSFGLASLASLFLK